MKSVLITGGAGFIGSNFIEYFLEKNQDVRVVNLDKLTYAGDLNNLKSVEKNPRYHFICGDIGNSELVAYILREFEISGVINFAAESHVDNSIKNPDTFIQTNINGTFNLINEAYRFWFDAPFKLKKHFKNINPRFHHISTDEVYGSLGDEGKFTETTPYAPNSPYSASKASSDMLVRSFRHTYGVNTIITNCSNNYGPKQHSEKLIPTIIRKALALEKIPIYGDGKNIRDWLYVTDHCEAIDLAFWQGRAGENYNIGGDSEKNNLEVASKVCEVLDTKKPRSDGKSYKELIGFVKDRAGHDRRYAIDATKIKNELGWSPKESFESGIEKTINWYLEKFAL